MSSVVGVRGARGNALLCERLQTTASGGELRTDGLEQCEHLDILPCPQELAHIPQLRQLRIRLALLRYPLPEEAGASAVLTACAESAPRLVDYGLGGGRRTHASLTV